MPMPMSPHSPPAAAAEAPAADAMSHSLRPAILELERAHAFFNGELFAGTLSARILVTVQTAGRKRAYGWFDRERWRDAELKVAELNLAAEELDRPVEKILETLVHEMVHQANAEAGVRDTSAGGRYHNGAFRARAEEAGLEVERDEKNGWAITRLGPRGRDALFRFKPKAEAFQVVRLVDPPKAPTKMKKWVCDCGPIRVGRAEFRAMCLECRQEFRLEDEQGTEGGDGIAA